MTSADFCAVSPRYLVCTSQQESNTNQPDGGARRQPPTPPATEHDLEMLDDTELDQDAAGAPGHTRMRSSCGSPDFGRD